MKHTITTILNHSFSDLLHAHHILGTNTKPHFTRRPFHPITRQPPASASMQLTSKTAPALPFQRVLPIHHNFGSGAGERKPYRSTVLPPSPSPVPSFLFLPFTILPYSASSFLPSFLPFLSPSSFMLKGD